MADTPAKPAVDLENLEQAKVYLQQTIDERIRIFGSAEAAKDDTVYKSAKGQMATVEAKLSKQPKKS